MHWGLPTAIRIFRVALLFLFSRTPLFPWPCFVNKLEFKSCADEVRRNIYSRWFKSIRSLVLRKSKLITTFCYNRCVLETLYSKWLVFVGNRNGLSHLVDKWFLTPGRQMIPHIWSMTGCGQWMICHIWSASTLSHLVTKVPKMHSS